MSDFCRTLPLKPHEGGCSICALRGGELCGPCLLNQTLVAPLAGMERYGEGWSGMKGRQLLQIACVNIRHLRAGPLQRAPWMGVLGSRPRTAAPRSDQKRRCRAVAWRRSLSTWPFPVVPVPRHLIQMIGTTGSIRESPAGREDTEMMRSSLSEMTLYTVRGAARCPGALRALYTLSSEAFWRAGWCSPVC